MKSHNSNGLQDFLRVIVKQQKNIDKNLFSSKIYSSWKKLQHDKYSQIFSRLKTTFFLGRTLDIGAGPNYLEKFLEENKIKAHIISLDIDKNSKANIIGNGNSLPFKSDSFDVVISIDSMHLISTNDFARVLKRGGFALFALFFNKENYHKRKELLKSRLSGFMVLKEFEVHGKENECVILAKKSHLL